MIIVLAEIRGEQKLPGREFKQTILKIGRDQQRCDLLFNQTQWPMVSRLHAEIRLEDGRYYLTDPGSTQGTFLNGQRIAAATEIIPGARIQFGIEGPIVVVESITAEPAAPDFSHTLIDSSASHQQEALRLKTQPRAQAQPPVVVARPPAEASHVPEPLTATEQPPVVRPLPQSAPLLVCESGSVAQPGRQFVLKDDRTLLGRDPSADIEIDAAAAAVSRQHAEVRRQADGTFLITDLKSFNGTLLNQQRIAQPERLYHRDHVQLGAGGPSFRFIDPSHPSPKGKPTSVLPGVALAEAATPGSSDDDVGPETIFYRPGTEQRSKPTADASGAQLLLQRSFNGKQNLSVGREPDNDIQLDGLVISKHHARFINTGDGVWVEEAGSTNGVYLNGGRISGRQPVTNRDVVQIGPFLLRVDPRMGVAVFDTRAKTRIDAIGITETVQRRSGRGSKKLLDDISLAIAPNEFVGLLGPSGAGKSTLMNALNGMHRTGNGRVLINNLELYQHLDSLKQGIGYVPQEDIIHRQLTVYRTLYYVARLRLSRDVARSEVDQIIGEVLDVTGLSSRRDVLVSELSGGQRKRVSIAVELITKPSVIFLDEPTSGLDPATEQRIMKLFRQIAESGRTVILTTHAMENVRLFDKVVLLMGGKLIFYGPPAEALKFVGATNFIDLYNKIEEPVEAEMAKLGQLPASAKEGELRTYETRGMEIAESVAEDWRRRFMATDLYRQYVSEPLKKVQSETKIAHPPPRRHSIIDAFLQWMTLVRRYIEVLASDKWNLFILFCQAPIIGGLTYLVVGKNDPRDFPYFILALVSIWFGTSVAAREIVKEGPIFRRERMVNLRLLPYLASKLLVLSLIVGLQATLLFGSLKILHFAEIMYLPGLFFGIPQLFVLTLTGIVGIAIGLFVSAVVKTSEVATSLVPLILIPQILFAGLTAVPAGMAKLMGAAMPATWSFDEMKRLSTLDTLKEEGSNLHGKNEGRGLLEHIKKLNARNIEDARIQIEDYHKRTTEAVKDHEQKVLESLKSGKGAAVSPGSPPPLAIGSPPPIPEPQEISNDLSGYVSFLHPWGSIVLDAAVLCLMLAGLIVATLIALRVKHP